MHFEYGDCALLALYVCEGFKGFHGLLPGRHVFFFLGEAFVNANHAVRKSQHERLHLVASPGVGSNFLFVELLGEDDLQL